MAKKALISEARLRKIFKRQNSPRWDSSYEPAQLATREEAPSISRASMTFVSKLGRDVHCMSLAERAAVSLAAYHPKLVDLHEQHVLNPLQAPHPLASHPRADGQVFPPVPGTLEVLERISRRLGIATRHPLVYMKDPRNPKGDGVPMPFPYLGDLLLLLEDRAGLYCVNWTVKKNVAAFASPIGNRLRASTYRRRANDRASFRHAVEAEYFADAGIPTVQVSEDAIDRLLIANLTTLLAWSARPLPCDNEKREKVWEAFRAEVGTKTALYTVLPHLQLKFALTRHECIRLFYEGVYRRKIRIDLYSPILVDRALRPERRDPLVEFAHWFAR